jgi:subtilisin family serine protease
MALASAAVAVSTTGATLSGNAPHPRNDVLPYVVVLGEDVAAPASTADRLGREGGFGVGRTYTAALKGFTATMSPAQVARLRADPSVRYVAPDVTFEAHAATPVAEQERVPRGVRRIGAATLTQVNDASDVAVAVLDTGLDLANPDLNAVSGVNCVAPGTPAQDDNGHGTHVGGTIGGRNTGSGVVGVAPGTQLYAVKVLNKRASGTLSSILCGIEWVTKHAAHLNIRVVNMSFGGRGRNDGACGELNADAEHQAICASVAAGITYVASAGNAKSNLAATVPAAYPQVLSVTASTETDGYPGGLGPAACARKELDDRYRSASNYAVADADSTHTIAAPGTCIGSTKLGGGVQTMSGTSMAAPHVAATAALCLGNGGVAGPCAGLTPAQIIIKLRDDARAAAEAGFGYLGDPFRPLAGRYYGYLASAAIY